MDEFRELALERVARLFEQAEKIFASNPELADRYVRAAWRLKTRYNLRLPGDIRLKFCRKCLSYWKPGVTCRVRVKSKRIIITCLKCGRVKRLPWGPRVGPGTDPGSLGKSVNTACDQKLED
ncbi:MAG: ribonuclease P protein component 4 [Candidatus Hadarchaeum sp.]|uniref:ribonuclease P protein component 4 n=1 Tax=Candidatus Hadarchaeum sp. TaxID=2883567 RepID=UPI003D0B9B78